MKQDKIFPSISILIPTLNSERTLEECLYSISRQNYPKNLIEIIIADGGSTDETLIIAKKFGAKIYKNPLKTAESGKAIALKRANNELIMLIDSDNILPDNKWIKKMIEPFSDPEIVGSEPWEFTYRKTAGFIDRYCALLGMNDPLCLFLGNYDKKSVLTNKWTSLKVKEVDRGDWLKITLESGIIPTIGANGTVFRRKVLIDNNQNSEYLFDVDIITELSRKRPINFAKVKIAVTHSFCGSNIMKFIRKQKRRVKDYLYYQKMGIRKYPWQRKPGYIKFVLYCITAIPLIIQSVKGYLKKPDLAWFFHPLACWFTFVIYGWGKIGSILKTEEMTREKWKQ